MTRSQSTGREYQTVTSVSTPKEYCVLILNRVSIVENPTQIWTDADQNIVLYTFMVF